MPSERRNFTELRPGPLAVSQSPSSQLPEQSSHSSPFESSVSPLEAPPPEPMSRHECAAVPLQTSCPKTRMRPVAAVWSPLIAQDFSTNGRSSASPPAFTSGTQEHCQ